MKYSDQTQYFLRLLGLGFGVPGLVLFLWTQMSTDFGMPWSQIVMIVLLTAVGYTLLGLPEYLRESKMIKLQSEKDGVDRPALHSFDKSKTLHDFAMDISAAAANMAALHKLFPMMNDLADLGRKLETEGLISPNVGDDYARSALNYFLNQYSVKTVQ